MPSARLQSPVNPLLLRSNGIESHPTHLLQCRSRCCKRLNPRSGTSSSSDIDANSSCSLVKPVKPPVKPVDPDAVPARHAKAGPQPLAGEMLMRDREARWCICMRGVMQPRMGGVTVRRMLVSPVRVEK
jgi:hypothetical protein